MAVITSILTTPTRLRLLGAAHSPEAFVLRDFLSRSVVACDWVELDAATVHGVPGIAGLDDPLLPVCEFPDGSRLMAATVEKVAKRLGWIEQPRLKIYDVSIYGAGPAGLSAAVWRAARR